MTPLIHHREHLQSHQALAVRSAQRSEVGRHPRSTNDPKKASRERA
jgi:hypothetical protein